MKIRSVLACAMFPVAAVAAVGMSNPDGRLGAIAVAFWNLVVALGGVAMSLLTVPAMGVVFVLPLLAAAGAGAVMWAYRMAPAPGSESGGAVAEFSALVCASVSAAFVGALLYQTSQPAIFAMAFLVATGTYFWGRKEERQDKKFDGDERKLANKCLLLTAFILGIVTAFAVFVADGMDRARARAATLEQIRQNIAQEEAIREERNARWEEERKRHAEVYGQISHMMTEMSKTKSEPASSVPTYSQEDIAALRGWLSSPSVLTAPDQRPDDLEALEIVVPAVGTIPSFRFVCRQQAYGLSVHTPMLPSIRDLSDTLTGICEARRGNY